MTTAAARSGRSARARKGGYVIAILINAALLYAINAWPGWGAVPFLSSDTPGVLGLVNASLVVGTVVNVVYLVADPGAVRAVGELLVLSVGLAATLRIWAVFPFNFDSSSIDWPLILRVLLALGIGGSIIGLIAQLVALVRTLTGRERQMR